jgi:GTP-binding protein LepA
LKTVRECRVGDTITLAVHARRTLPGYKQAKPMVFAGFYPSDNDDYNELRDALEKLQLNDASLVYEPETSQALNFGFRVGFLGLFHMEIVQERLEREYGLDIVATSPSVEYRSCCAVATCSASTARLICRRSTIAEIRNPGCPSKSSRQRFIGPIMDLVTGARRICQHGLPGCQARPAQIQDSPVRTDRRFL